MCGRYSFSTSKEKLERELGSLTIDDALDSRYNIAPTQEAYVITNTAPHTLQKFRWGLLPFWTKPDQRSAPLINARSEGVENKPSFRTPIRERRCLVPADSFYEWQRQNGQKVPFRIFPAEDSLLIMAGIWDIWRSPAGPVYSFSILTTTPNTEVSTLHDRMPVVLPGKDIRDKWLAQDTPLTEVLDLLQPVRDGYFNYYPVSTDVNNVRHEGAYLHDRLGIIGPEL